ncbi:hypothetical protein ACS127_05430 [Amphibacillus sp. Q70]|uniref:hypothetical protein n=1 Tax=Amphibacillus sp. Q70 TaxID=3453416 RepID=UPI003F826CF7
MIKTNIYFSGWIKKEVDILKYRRGIAGLHFFVAVGAIIGGIPAIFNPINPMGMPDDALINGPFTSFLIPGLFLFFVLGCTNFVAGMMTIRQLPLYYYVNMLMGFILCMWIIIQCYVLWGIVFLHVLFFAIGLVQIWLGFREWQRVR